VAALRGDDAATVPRKISGQLPHPVRAYRRVAAAAARGHAALSSLEGRSTAIDAVRRQTWAACFGEDLIHALRLERVIRDHDVLILGETGTGKELVAHAIQAATPAPKGSGPAPQSAVNAAAIPETLVEGELFGHVRGAFTGATDARAGRLRSADGGTFFLPEVGDLATAAQVALLRVMETNVVTPVGADAGTPVDVRYVAATHRDLRAMVDAGDFRRDLLERLAGVVIRLPPLRDRPDDIVAIGRAFVAPFFEGTVPDDVEQWLQASMRRPHAWLGNVRELHNALRSLMLGLPTGLRDDPVPVPELDRIPLRIRQRRATLREVETWYVGEVLSRAEGNYAEAARTLEVHRSTVMRRHKEGREDG
jgi:DNA-binding NtrC family response regulator